MSKHEIDLPELPEGWKPVVYRKPYSGEHIFNNGYIKVATIGMIGCWLIVEKIQPLRRIVLEETSEYRKVTYKEWYEDGEVISMWYHHAESSQKYKIWREVEETNDDDKLSLSVDECKDVTVLTRKISEFLKDKS